MAQRIDKLKAPPVVGKFYMVPCIRVTESSYLPPGLWPITGPKHEDAELLNFPFQHFHVDVRFLTPKQVRAHGSPYGLGDGSSVRSVLVRPITVTFADGSPNSVRWSGPELAELRCRRKMPLYPEVADQPLWKQLGDAYADKRVKCGKCPHRGLPLESLPREPGTDIVTCPGHGLRWDLKTGEMVR